MNIEYRKLKKTLSLQIFIWNKSLLRRCVKRVQIRSFFWFEYKKIRTRKNSVFGYFSHTVRIKNTLNKCPRYTVVYLRYLVPWHFCFLYIQFYSGVTSASKKHPKNSFCYFARLSNICITSCNFLQHLNNILQNFPVKIRGITDKSNAIAFRNSWL